MVPTRRVHGAQAQHHTRVADDALSDPDRVVIAPDYNSTSGRSVRIIGYSLMADEIIAVIVVEEDGIEYGVNGWVASVKDRRIYRDTKNASGGSEEASDP